MKLQFIWMTVITTNAVLKTYKCYRNFLHYVLLGVFKSSDFE